MGKDINYYEIYNASEGFFGIQDRSGADDMLLMLDYGIFYEFIPMEYFGESHPKTITLEDVEVGKNYAMVLETNGWAMAYLIGRTKHYINTFGEELMIDNVEVALKKACDYTNAEIIDYTGAPIYMNGNESGAHEWVIEFSRKPSEIEAFARIFDDTLKKVNCRLRSANAITT
ncbi:hypothetical protein FQR65_LT18591 [Abscondita terminalis]|nr:hypothetical protein FQR65_LT18591 [Abscondita terminalis]